MTPLRRHAPIYLALITLSCAGTSIRREAADVLMPVDQEIQLGKQVRAQVLKDAKPLDDPQVQAYVQQVGAKLVALDQGELPKGIHPTFTVLDSPQVNAFAIPGGDIFVYSGLLNAAQNEAELAGVLAHELGHVAKRHVAQGMVTQLGLETLASIALGQNPSALAQIGATIAANGYLLRYSRENETEADHVGMATMIRSHDWDPHAMITFFNELAAQGGSPGFLSFLSSHPPPADRAQYLTAQLQAAGNPGGADYRDRYAAIQAQVPKRSASEAQPPKG